MVIVQSAFITRKFHLILQGYKITELYYYINRCKLNLWLTIPMRVVAINQASYSSISDGSKMIHKRLPHVDFLNQICYFSIEWLINCSHENIHKTYLKQLLDI